MIVSVPLPAGRDASYDVVIGSGALEELPARLGSACPAARYAVVADSTVAALYGDAVTARLGAAGLDTRLFTFPAGESHKTRATWADLTDALLAARIGRDGAIVALGGGITGDLAGFVAATYLRGVPFVQVPTSALAMIDAAVGGKAAVDVPAGKNLVGAFHQPRLVVADTDTLRTLPAAGLADGLAEAVKHGVIADAAYLAYLEEHAAAILARDARALEHVVARSVAIKAGIVAADPREAGRRAVLNFGHTVGHALEAAAGFMLPHGAAVAAGMVAEARLGEQARRTQPGTAARITAAVTRFGLPATPPVALGVDDLVDRMRSDKKVRAGGLRFALLAAIGTADGDDARGWTVEIAADVVRHVLAEWAAVATR
ncbi:MAG TPA: 3-dehydroquinate synthase [Gemmatimonadales bacterium]|nr:3-dehydroquinate synthase [Gemmatimonadales bacterium]